MASRKVVHVSLKFNVIAKDSTWGNRPVCHLFHKTFSVMLINIQDLVGNPVMTSRLFLISSQLLTKTEFLIDVVMVEVCNSVSHNAFLISNQIKSSLFLLSTKIFCNGSLTIRHTHERSTREAGAYLAGCLSKGKEKEWKEKCVMKIKTAKQKW